MSRPTIVCLCGSTRFRDAFEIANYEETLKGKIVLSVGFYPHLMYKITPEQKEALDILHFRKIDLADEILVLNVEGYIGYSTKREIAYALGHHTKVRFLDESLGEKFLVDNSHEMGKLVAELF